MTAIALQARFKNMPRVPSLVEVAPGVGLGIFGANGVGKTTLLRAVVGLMDEDVCDVSVAGIQRSTSRADVQSRIGFVPDRPHLYETLSIAENVSAFAALYGRAMDRNIAQQLLEPAGLWAERNKAVQYCSAGIRQRASICVARIHAPLLLVMDEPTVGLDAEGEQWLRDMVADHLRSGGALLVASHDTRLLRATTSRTWVLSYHDDSRIVASSELPESNA